MNYVNYSILFLHVIKTSKHTHRFNDHLPGQPQLAGCPLFSHPYSEHPHRIDQSSLYPHRTYGYTVNPSLTLTATPMCFEAEIQNINSASKNQNNIALK